jgi:Mg2+/Co2+ transporter CorB
MQWDLPIESAKTLNGLILDFMETIPNTGTSIRLHGHPLEILKRDENSVKLVKFLPRNNPKLV